MLCSAVSFTGGPSLTAPVMRSFTVIETELGWVGLMRSDGGLCAATLPRRTPQAALQQLDPRSSDVLVGEEAFADAAAALHRLLAGHAGPMGEPLDLSRGTAFQQAVWEAVLTIPYGETRSYGWVAEAIGRPLAAHAVGQAVASNPLPLFIPCHRVIAANGELGGYGSGAESLPMKRSLLRREGIDFFGPLLEDDRTVAARRSSGEEWER